MLIKRYNVKNDILKHLIKYFWVVNAASQDLNHKFLPVCNIDLVLNLGHKAKYITNNKEITIASRLYFNGITESYKFQVQKGALNMLGISFWPAGLFPFLKIPLNEFKNNTIELDQAYKQLSVEIIDKIQDLNNIDYSLKVLEEILLKYIDYHMIMDNRSLRVFNSFNNSLTHLRIDKFCLEYGINKKRLERLFNKYIGISPKIYSKIRRFQNCIRQLENNNYTTLTDLAYQNNFYDQMHFIKNFKSLTGATPTDYIFKKSSLRDIITLV